MDLISQFIGRFHPLVVHFPIGILFIAFFFECISRINAYEKLRAAVQPALLVGVISAIVSVITGLLLSDEGGYDDDLLYSHKVLGIVTAAMASVIYVLRMLSGKLFKNDHRQKAFDLILFVSLIVIVSLTGHYGGSMTHGPDYLFAAIEARADDDAEPSLQLQKIADVNDAVLYSDLVRPILESRCYSCHSSRRQKGDLRLDGIEFINRGGENGPVVQAGIPDSSSLFSRLLLPLEHDDHMPPNEKPQPSSAEIALIQAWIKEGADFDMKVSASREPEKIKTYFASLVEQSNKEKLAPDEEVNPGDEKVIEQLKRTGVIVLPISAGSNYLSISFVNRRTVSEKEVSLLLPLKSQILWLDLARTTISDKELAMLGQLGTLRRLNLQNTAITDQGVSSLSSLSNLQHLNLAGTRTSDKALMSLAAINSLQKVFVYQTDVTGMGIRELRAKVPGIQVDTGGYALPRLLTDSVIVEFDPN